MASDAASYITATSINVTGGNLIKFLSYIYAYLRENSNFIQSIEGAKE
ncbi:MAG: hypothetical protein ACTH45_08770 [Lactobacillus helveticus]|nr:hypothetical protein [Lactobacillus helveticus]